MCAHYPSDSNWQDLVILLFYRPGSGVFLFVSFGLFFFFVCVCAGPVDIQLNMCLEVMREDRNTFSLARKFRGT